uniref:uncharacterized protein LOC124010479 n=1 Tax=Oncorhynchus gorbuscha TaxID=8017 RepID=UPI001EAE868C|nr:uncharacterized protein LOC124010479 [Oncorhynchus gorbuscha]
MVSLRPLTTTSCLFIIKSINAADLYHIHFTHFTETDRPRDRQREAERDRERQRTRDHGLKMIKSVVVVMFLNMLHLGLGNNLRTEILEDLEKLTLKNFKFTLLPNRVPTQEMEDNALECKCQGVFATQLKRVVNKVMPRTEEHKPLLNRLQKNIQALPQISTHEEARICPMMDKKIPHLQTTIVLMKYILFLRNLNENECV